MHTDICEAMVCNEHLLAVVLDIEKAYDMVWRERVVKILSENGVDGNVLAFIANFLKRRRIRVKFNGILSDEYEIANGVPQGSVLSVTLFPVAINEIAEMISLPVEKSIFADDVTITCRGKNINTTQECIQNTLRCVENWALNSGFRFSVQKCRFILFSRNQDKNEEVQLYLKNVEIERTDIVEHFPTFSVICV
jgi:hypothetical protein